MAFTIWKPGPETSRNPVWVPRRRSSTCSARARKPEAIDSKTTPGKVEVGAPPQGMQGLAGRVDGGFVTQMDIDADNGVIHAIDGVASPKVPLIGQNGGYVAGTEPGSGEGRTGLDTKVTSSGGGGGGW